MTRPTVAEIELDAILHNYNSIMGLCPDESVGFAVVKADAYGHGAIAVARHLQANDVGAFAVATTEEAVELRDAGVTGRILMLGLTERDDADELVPRGIECIVGHRRQIDLFDEAASAAGRTAELHLKVDTGLGRIGFEPERALEAAQAIRAKRRLRLAGVMTHFSVADDPQGDPFTREQIRCFESLRSDFEKAGVTVPLWHAAATMGTLRFPEAHFSGIRPGIGIYGCATAPPASRPVALRPAMTLRTRIAAIRALPEGATVSYGRTWRAVRPSRVAILPIGYGDGYSRGLSNKGEVLVRGQRAPVVGNICMDHTMVDVTAVEGAAEGDDVVLVGRQGGGEITASELAQRLDTIPYVITTSVSRRVPRRHISGSRPQA